LGNETVAGQLDEVLAANDDTAKFLSLARLAETMTQTEQALDLLLRLYESMNRPESQIAPAAMTITLRQIGALSDLVGDEGLSKIEATLSSEPHARFEAAPGIERSLGRVKQQADLAMNGMPAPRGMR
jgi:hypothetical protein